MAPSLPEIPKRLVLAWLLSPQADVTLAVPCGDLHIVSRGTELWEKCPFCILARYEDTSEQGLMLN